MITATNESSGSNFTPVAAGAYLARCYSMVHIGTVKETVQGKEKMLNKVRIAFELPTETREFKEGEGEKPFVVAKEFTLSMHEKSTLRKMLEGWRGKAFTDEESKAFDITRLLGVPCLLSVIHKTSAAGKLRAEIASISAVPKGMTCPPQVNPSFEFGHEQWSDEKFATLPEFWQNKIKSSVEYAARFSQSNTAKPYTASKSYTAEEIDAMQAEAFEKRMAAEESNDLPF